MFQNHPSRTDKLYLQKQKLLQGDTGDSSSSSYNHAASVHYNVHAKENVSSSNVNKEITVCKKAFISLHCITIGMLRRYQSRLREIWKSPVDRRDSYSNRPTAVPAETENLIEARAKADPLHAMEALGGEEV
jgi:hypothetical protein